MRDEEVTGPPTPIGSVYVHAPFCARRCFYCDFAVQVRRTGGADEWLEALRAELRALEEEALFRLDDVLYTLYVGGGTPSLLGPGAMQGLADALGRFRLSGPALEWTAEANPESFTDEVASAWRSAGVNRLSFGVQSFHPDALRWMGRLHGPEGARDAVRRARAAGFDNVSVDLIFGLPPSVGRSWSSDLEGALSLDVEHVSLYGLSVEERTPLGRAVREGRAPPVDEEQYRDEYLLAVKVLTDAGYEHYEVSNFARAGRASRHNAVYWDGSPYLGLGNGAHSYAPPLRRWNVRDWDEYARMVRGGTVGEEGRELVGGGARRLENVWLSLRTATGLSASSLSPQARQRIAVWVRGGLAELDGDVVRLTSEGWLLLDRLAVELDEALEPDTSA